MFKSIFTLGTIATIIALIKIHWLDTPVMGIPAKIPLFFWGFYVVITTIGISGDIFPHPRFIKAARDLGHACNSTPHVQRVGS